MKSFSAGGRHNTSEGEFIDMSDIEKVVMQVERFMFEAREQLPIIEELPIEKQELTKNQLWCNEVEKLQAQFKIDNL